MVLEFGLLDTKLFESSSASGEGMNADPNTVIWNDVGIGIIPIGGICAWAKSISGVPSLLPSFVECNGQSLSDPDSPLNGQTIPNLNASGGGTKRFLRGSTTSGTTGGSETHLHSNANNDSFSIGGAPGIVGGTNTGSTSTLPSYYEVVWVMRVK